MARINPAAKLEAMFHELEEVASRMGLQVILDKGPFTGGACILEGEQLIVLNKSTPLEQRTRLLAEALCQLDLSNVYLKPAVRAVLENYQELGAPFES
ncbi:hypothetical protein ACFL6Q_04800 [Candidatus Neomarinimicrobiota bacterium]